MSDNTIEKTMEAASEVWKTITIENMDACDRVAATQGIAAAIALAKSNARTWGAEWLVKHDALVVAETAKDTEVSKALAKLESDVDKARAELEGYVAKVAGERYIDASRAGVDLTREKDPKYQRLAGDLSKALDARILFATRKSEEVAKAAEPRSLEIKAKIDRVVEDFALQHNCTIVEAQKRLPAISPSYKALYLEWSIAENERIAAYQETEARIARAQQFTPQPGGSQGDMAARELAANSPALAKFNASLAAYAASVNKTPVLATGDFLRTPEGSAAYQETQLEAMRRVF